MPPANSSSSVHPLSVTDRSAVPALIALAESGIAREVKEYFPDMTVRRHMEHRMRAASPTTGVPSDDAAGYPSRKRCRRSIVEQLIDEIPKGRLADDELVRHTTGGAISTYSSTQAEIQCSACQTRVLSCRPCEVLTGYYVMWAETVSQLCVAAASSHGMDNAPFAAAAATDRSQEPNRATDNQQQQQPVSRRKRGGHIGTATSDAATTTVVNNASLSLCALLPHADQITFHSIHFIHRDVLSNQRRASFALQSIFQVDKPTELECYPQHMMHMGLVCHALWNTPAAAMMKMSSLLSSSPTRRLKKTLSPTSSYNGDAMTQSWACMLPNKGVLILGLGGNVLGQCCDAILPPSVPLHVVEIEPAVLAACEAHGQTPPLTKQHSSKGRRRGCASSYTAAAPHPRGDKYKFFIEDAAVFLKSSAMTSKYSLIFLDCYDTEAESMMHSQGLLRLCQARLCPGGCLLVNAHVLPSKDVLKDHFMGHGGFATVHALRVSGCDQSIVVCIAGHHEDGEGKTAMGDGDDDDVSDAARMGLLTRSHAVHAARVLNAMSQAGDGFLGGFELEPDWLTSCRKVCGTVTEGLCCVWGHQH